MYARGGRRLTASKSCATTSWGIRRETTSETLSIRLSFWVFDCRRRRGDDDRQQGDDREKSDEELLHVEMVSRQVRTVCFICVVG